MGKAQDTYTLDDLQSDAGHLGHLIDAIADLMVDGVEYSAPADGHTGRLKGMDRLNALVWIARGQISVLNDNIEKHYSEIKGGETGGADA